MKDHRKLTIEIIDGEVQLTMVDFTRAQSMMLLREALTRLDDDERIGAGLASRNKQENPDGQD